MSRPISEIEADIVSNKSKYIELNENLLDLYAELDQAKKEANNGTT